MEVPVSRPFPPGLLRTTDEIYEEVASYPVVPVHELRRYWHVYTVTYRQYDDPTVSRLESFWWHVMGSDRRFLSGKALAKLYKEISTGPSFAPLRGPSHSLRMPMIPKLSRTQADETDPGDDIQADGRTEPVEVPSRRTPEKQAPKGAMASSSSRPPPPHPILKKSRGPSTSGPRPTARFVSPHDSEEEMAKEDDSSSESIPTKHVQMRPPPAKSPVKGEKKAPPTGRKFTASSAAKRHVRPGLGRRPSSQSSVEGSGKAAASTSGGKTSSGTRLHSVEQSSLASSGHSGFGRSPALSAKAAGKRPEVLPRKTGGDEDCSTPRARDRTPLVTDQGVHSTTVPLASSMERSRSNPPRSPGIASVVSTLQTETPPTHSGRIQEQLTAPPMGRSQSNIENQRYRPSRDIHHPPIHLPQSLITPKSTPVAKKVADIAVQVQFDSDSVKSAQDTGADSMAKDLPDSISIASRPSTTSLYTPTQPSPTPAPFLGRSKSQLTLLLEKMDHQGKGKGKHRDH